MSDASISERMSPELLRVVERARGEPGARFHSLTHLIDVPALQRSDQRQRKHAAAGVDGVMKEQYGQALQANLSDLHERMKTMRYRHRRLKGAHIQKGPNQT
jgi:RNA-directed DNA polymerase